LGRKVSGTKSNRKLVAIIPEITTIRPVNLKAINPQANMRKTSTKMIELFLKPAAMNNEKKINTNE
jgi:hypothetical protein